jgi:hypothetical protein
MSVRVETIIKLLEERIPSFADNRGYSPLGPFADRHGSWEMSLFKRNDLDRYVTFSLIGSLPSVDAGVGRYDIEIWVGADRLRHYTRRLAWSYALDGEQLLRSGSETWSVIDAGVRQSVVMADSLTPADLMDSYLLQDAKEHVV